MTDSSLRAAAALALLCLAHAFSLDAQQASPRGHAAELKQLESHLAAGDVAKATALLGTLQPDLDADERFAFDAIYVLIAGRRFPEAKDQWNRLAPRLQEAFRAASGPSPPGDPVRRRVAEALFVQGLLTSRLGRKEDALRLLQQADGYGFPPLDSPLMVLAGDCLFELGEHALAAQAYQEVVSRAPGNVQARLRLGASLYSSGKLGAAGKELEEVLRRAPEQPHAHFYLGAVLVDERRTDEARPHLERALRLDPGCSGCMAKLAHIAYLDGDNRTCESWLARVSALDPDSVEANLVFGMLANRAARYDEAIRRLTRVVERAPGYAKAQYQLALAYGRSGNAAKAREHQDIYNRLIQEQKAETLGVRGEVK